MLLDKRIPVSYIFNKVKYDILYVLILSLSVVHFTNNFQQRLPEMPLTIPTFIGTAISILLSFKLSQSYDRWWEARKIWGSIVNDSRSLVMQLNTLVQDREHPAIKTIALRQVAWCYSLARSLRGLDPLENSAEYIEPNEIAFLHKHSNKPLGMLQLHSEDIRRLKDLGQIDTFAHMQLDDTIVRLCDAQGRAERIKSTVFPVTYRMFLHFIIYLFVTTLSLSLKNVAGYFEIPLLLLISGAFFLLEKSATHMQDPFENKPTDTAMTSISRKIEINIKELLKIEPIPGPIEPNGFYLP